MSRYENLSNERKRGQLKEEIPLWLFNYCHERFEYSESMKGLLIKKSEKWKGKVGYKPGSLRPDKRRIICIKQHRYFEHQLVWLMFNNEFPSLQLDHINRDPTDNRIGNLRLSSHKQNNCNKDIQSNNTTGFKGVNYRKDLKSKPYYAYIKNNGILYNLGYFCDAISAAKAYDKKAKDFFGEFARLNFGENNESI